MAQYQDDRVDTSGSYHQHLQEIEREVREYRVDEAAVRLNLEADEHHEGEEEGLI